MKKLYFILFLYLLCFQALAQNPCYVTIPPDVELIRKNPFTEKVAKNKSYWICNQSTVTFRIGQGTFFVDEGSKLTLIKGTYTVYLRKNAQLVLGAGAKGVIHRERGASVNTGFSTYMQQVPCEVLAFDFSQAPSGICPQIERTIPENPTIENPVDTTAQNSSNTNPDFVDANAHIIPPNAKVVNNGVMGTRKTGSSQTYWVCEQGKLVQTGNNNVFYIENGGTLEIYSGSNNIIYLKDNTKLRLGSGSKNQVFYIGNAELLSDRSRDTKFTKLVEMEFDYSQAPSEGCR